MTGRGLMGRWAWPCGWTLGALGVILGAFGAHALRERFDPRTLGWWQTAVQYHMIHALVLLVIGRMAREGRRFASAASICLLAGTLVFSGTLYVMAVTGNPWLGRITPIGGGLLIIGWLLGALASRDSASRELAECTDNS